MYPYEAEAASARSEEHLRACFSDEALGTSIKYFNSSKQWFEVLNFANACHLAAACEGKAAWDHVEDHLTCPKTL